MAITDGVDVQRLIRGYERGLVALKEVEPAGKSARDPGKAGEFSTGLGDDLSLLCTKIAPTMSEDQADAWIKVTVTALSDLPGRVAREAAQKALHRPMRFLNEVEAEVRSLAVDVAARHSIALRNLRTLEAEIRRAAEPAPAIEGATEAPPITLAGIRAMTPEMRKMGIGLGAITQEEVDAALSDELKAAA